jgi:hypothetical protein
LALALLAAAGQGRRQPTPPAAIAGCYAVEQAAWSPSVGADSQYHRLPPVVRLDTVAAGRAGSRRLTPDIAYPEPLELPQAPQWRIAGSGIRLDWSNGFSATVVMLRGGGATLVGEATAVSDVDKPGEPPRARVVLRRRACDATRVRPPAI